MNMKSFLSSRGKKTVAAALAVAGIATVGAGCTPMGPGASRGWVQYSPSATVTLNTKALMVTSVECRQPYKDNCKKVEVINTDIRDHNVNGKNQRWIETVLVKVTYHNGDTTLQRTR